MLNLMIQVNIVCKMKLKNKSLSKKLMRNRD